jgi:hypothetical protein
VLKAFWEQFNGKKDSKIFDVLVSDNGINAVFRGTHMSGVEHRIDRQTYPKPEHDLAFCAIRRLLLEILGPLGLSTEEDIISQSHGPLDALPARASAIR